MKSDPGNREVLSIIAVILILFQTGGSSQAQLLQENIDKFNVKNYHEELYLSTDRDIYITGEQVWFKVYKINALDQLPGNISKVAYVELLDKSNTPVRQIKLKTEGHSGSSAFVLPDNLSSGNYTIRAYTLWMQNFSPDLYSYRTISVINPFESIEHLRIQIKKRFADSVVIYPEGGTLIPGQSTRIAFRSYDKAGSPVPLRGVILRNSRDTICQVSTRENGFGIAEIRTKENENYSLSYKSDNGKNKILQLPETSGTGYGLRADYSTVQNSFLVKITMNEGTSAGIRKINFAVASAGSLILFKQFDCSRDTTITIPRNSLPEGLSQLLLFDNNGSSIAGRSIYKDHDKNLNFIIGTAKTDYHPREKVGLKIDVTDNSGNPIEAELSVSVTKSAIARSSADDKNLTGMDPGLTDMNRKSVQEINDYLISSPAQGVNHASLMNPGNITFRYLPELEGHQIRGHMRYKDIDEPLRNTDISLSYVGKTARCQFGKTDEKGDFNFLIKESGVNEIVIQPLSPDITKYYTEINQSFSDTYSHFTLPFFFPDSNRIGGINNAVISMQISNIYEPFREKKAEAAAAPSIDFYGKPENTIKMVDYIELTTLREVVKEILPNVYTVKQSGKYDFKLINKFRGQPFTNIPLILVDGVPIYDFEKVLNVNSKEIDRADIVNTRYFFSKDVFDGIVSFISKKGDLSVLEFDNTIFRQVYEGCQIPAAFYSPDYSKPALKNGRIPDFRNTLCWEPELRSGKDGKAELGFYSSDESTEYLIRVEGIAKDGTRGTATFPSGDKIKIGQF